ncbi:hypothetical protein [Tessaracoccus massiliensis]|nr:hypothetical protein [Tessaracoccus massiliensis]
MATTNSGSSRASLRQQQEADERAQRSRRIVIAGIGIAAAHPTSWATSS